MEPMTDKHPVTPPPELVQQWLDEWMTNVLPGTAPQYIATQAARYGADQELEECINWIRERPCTWTVEQLRAARRPNPKNLGETALVSLETIEEDLMVGDEAHPNDFVTIRRALERLQELEEQADD